MKLNLEGLSERILPSAATATPEQVENFTSKIVAVEQQWMYQLVTAEQVLVNLADTLYLKIVQMADAVVQDLEHLAGIPTPPSGSGSGSGSGSSNPTQNPPNQPTKPIAQQSGSGSGSGSTTSHDKPSKAGGALKPMDSGSGSLYVYFGSGSNPVPEPDACSSSYVTREVLLSQATDHPVTVDYETVDGTAKAGTDYVETDGYVTIPGGQVSSTQPILIAILDDGNDETVGTEYFDVELTGAEGAVMGEPYISEVDITEGPVQQPTDTLRWNPCTDNNASTVTNWYDVTQGFQLQKGTPGVTASSPIQFDAKATDTPNSNQSITWDKDFTVASITLTQYTGQMTLEDGSSVTVKANIVEDPASTLKVDFQVDTSHLTVQSDTSTLTNFNFSDDNGQFVAESFAFVNMLAQYNEQSVATIDVKSGATLEISGQGAGLVFKKSQGTTPQLWIESGGSLWLDGTSGNGTFASTLGVDAILYNQGKVLFWTSPGFVNNLNIPVLNLGQFSVKGGGGPGIQGGTLSINATSQQTANVDFDMTGGKLEIFYAATLSLGTGYVQSGGNLETLDDYQEVLLVASGGGIAKISGGKVILDTETVDPEVGGNLLIDCSELDFTGGEYDPKIDGQNSGSCDLLTIQGNGGALKLQGATMTVTVLHNPGVGTWPIVKYTTRTGTFNNPTLNGTTVHYSDATKQVYLT